MMISYWYLVFSPNGLDTGLTYYLVTAPSGTGDILGAPVRTSFPFRLSSFDITPTFLLSLLATTSGIFLIEFARLAWKNRPRMTPKRISPWLFE
jgi:hypothetical protein